MSIKRMVRLCGNAHRVFDRKCFMEVEEVDVEMEVEGKGC